MRNLRTFTVIPSLPPELEPLRKLSTNLWWSWSHEAISVFHRMERDLWEKTEHNPVRVLGSIPQARLDELAQNDGFLAHAQRVMESLKQYDRFQAWFEKTHPDRTARVAYFSAEYGITDCLPIYSGGLGVLAGDHIKSCSDLGIPLVGVGLLYRMGYFRQYLNRDGWQQERYPENDFYNMTIERVLDGERQPVTVSVEVLERQVQAQVWLAQVGRIPLYLLDANLEANHPDDRQITAQLYGGDLEMRIKQEILLGVGGQRALELLGIEPTVCHMNEGHSAFQALERIRRLMVQPGLSFAEARAATAAGNVFTTHTPVPAGNDMFPPALVEKYMASYWQQLGLSKDQFMGLGRINPDDAHEPFCMTVLAIRLAEFANGVSRLHGDVSRSMWQGIWPEVPEEEVPIRHITNGIHIQTWVARDMAALYDRYLGPAWRALGGSPQRNGNGRSTLDGEADLPEMERIWARVNSIPDEELWRIHERLRARLVAFARSKLRHSLEHQGAPVTEVEQAAEVLDPEALTIGFARRFATYKRATLLFRDLDRLKRILSDKKRPVQIIIAGKAHPRDNAGKELIRQIIHHARDPVLRRHVVFLEDYSMAVARRLVQGVDLWLNTPRRPMEASGTSGMKCAPNGGINLSTPDGWWVEGEGSDNGWTIGKGEEYESNEYMDDVESQALYDLLEKEVVPLFYSRSETDLPRGWIKNMKASIRTVCSVFNTDRMVSEYTDQFYIPATGRSRLLSEDGFKMAREMAAWQERLEQQWSNVSIESVEASTDRELVVNSALPVKAVLRLGELQPDELTVQLFHGPVDSKGELEQGRSIIMEDCQANGDNTFVYSGAIPCRGSGRHGFAIRVLPKHPDLKTRFIPKLIEWG